MTSKSVEFTLNGRRYRVTVEEVEQALKGSDPERVWDLAVWVDGAWYPPKQALVKPIGLTNRDINSRFAVRQLAKLGFPIHDAKVDGPLPDEPGASPSASTTDRAEAMRLAVQLLAGTGATAGDAIAAADEIGDWIAG